MISRILFFTFLNKQKKNNNKLYEMTRSFEKNLMKV